MATIQFQFDENAQPNEGGPRGSATPTPEGTHHIKILTVEEKAAREGGQYGALSFQYEVVQSDDATAIGKTRWMRLSLSPKSTPYFLVPLIQAAGANMARGTVATAAGPQAAGQFDAEELVGAVVIGKCKHRKDGTKVYEDWSDFAVSNLNPRLAGSPAAPAMQPAPQAAPQQPAGFQPQPQAQVGFQPQAMPQPQGQVPPRRFG